MANYYTQFSAVLNVGSPENVQKALDLIPVVAREIENESYWGEDEPYLLFTASPGEDNAIYLYDEQDGAPKDVGAWVKRVGKELGLTGKWGFTWASTCDRPRLDSFTGGAWMIDFATGEDEWFSTGQWLEEKLKENGE